MNLEDVQVPSKPKFIPKRPRIISLINNKGGVFKTTLSFNLAKNWLRNNRSVATIDFDQQENLTRMLPEITQTGIKAEELCEIEADYIIVDTGPTFTQAHVRLFVESDIIITPFALDRLDIEQTRNMLETAKALNATDKVKLIVIHSGHHTQLYKSLKPFVEDLCNEYGVEVLCEMRRNQAVPKANLSNQTVFETQSPPDVRKEFKNLFKAVGERLACLKH